MRLDRFSSWYTDKLGGESKYEGEYERIIKTWTNSFVQSRRIGKLQWRYRAMRVYNPRSLVHRHTRPHLSAILTHLSVSNNVKSMKDAIELGLISDEWDRDAWHAYYASGIPPFDSHRFFEDIISNINEDVSQKYEDDFSKKLRRWVGDEILDGAKLYKTGVI